MDTDHKGNVEALKDGLKEAAEANRNHIVRPTDAKQYADSLQSILDEAFDKDAQNNMAENKIDAHVVSCYRIGQFDAATTMAALRSAERLADWAKEKGFNPYRDKG